MYKHKCFTIYLIILNNFKSITCEKFIGSDVKFLLYTSPFNDYNYSLTYGDLNNIISSPFEPVLKTKIIIHGFQSNCMDDVFIKIKDAYLTKYDYNIICVDWYHGAKRSYLEAIENTWIAGDFLSQFLDWLIYETGLDSHDVHIIGHSLGAHVAGIAGSNMKLGIIGQITGLDPAVPMIQFDPDKTLDLFDALTVDLFFTSFLSYGHPLAHINYLINGGINQPNCNSQETTRVKKYYGGSIICNHSKAYEIFAEFILNLTAYHIYVCQNIMLALMNDCQSYEKRHYFNLNPDYIENGIYYVETA